MAKTKLKLEHIPLHCPVCKQRFMNVFGKPLPNHAQIRCVTSDGNEMDLGICENCINEGVTMEMVDAVLEGIKDYWVAEVDSNKTLKVAEKQQRREFHRSHRITEMKAIINTGKRAEKEARKKSLLL